MKITVAPIVPMRKATSGAFAEDIRTNNMPRIEQINPVEAKARGANINISRLPPAIVFTAATDKVAPMAMVAIIEPQ